MHSRHIKISLFLILACPFLIWIKAWLVLTILIITALLFSITATYNKISNIWIPLPKIAKRAFHWFWVIFSSALVVFFVKTYIVDIFRLPSTSMQPETQSGDVIVINKLLMGPRLSPNECSKYVRAWGYSQLKHNDLIIFNFPEGDTILNNHPTDSYYALKRTNSYNFNSDSIGEKSYRTVAHRPRYIKRVIGLPGDTFQIIQSQLYINHQIIIPSEHYIAKYEILDTLKAEQLLIKHEIVPIARISYQRKKIIELDASLLKSHPDLSSSLKTFYLERNMPDPNVFPHTFMWNSDNMGPLVIPGKGDVIDINIKNIDIYARIIGVYEQNKLEVKGKKIFINGNEAVKYTFKMNYYWVMGDNQPHSFDSRYWGFLPENHIIGISRTHLRF